jgi:hypothetical protein
MSISPEQEHVLHVALEREAELAVRPHPGYSRDPWNVRARIRLRRELAYGPLFNALKWFGVAHASADHRRYVRAVHALAEAGLVALTGGYRGARVTNLRLTEAGRALARQLAAKQAAVAHGDVPPM